MASTSPLCHAERLELRSDLVLRPIPEIRMGMVYRPRPARIVTLNPSSWLLLELCDGSTVGDIEAAYVEQLASKAPASDAAQVRQGLQELISLALVRVCDDSSIDEPVQHRSDK